MFNIQVFWPRHLQREDLARPAAHGTAPHARHTGQDSPALTRWPSPSGSEHSGQEPARRRRLTSGGSTDTTFFRTSLLRKDGPRLYAATSMGPTNPGMPINIVPKRPQGPPQSGRSTTPRDQDCGQLRADLHRPDSASTTEQSLHIWLSSN